jgi:ribonuclease HII
MKKRKFSYVAGIDEAGRGPLAGPVAVGVLLVSVERLSEVRKIFKSLRVKNGYPFRDSKQLSEKERMSIYVLLKQLRNARVLNFTVSLVGASVIDKKGIVASIKLGMKRALKRVGCSPTQTKVYLDGSLRAPQNFSIQETIIKGDQRKLEIALASICAKVERDRYMTNQSKNFPDYGFSRNKGYGTQEHRKAIQKKGKCVLHRESYLGNFE